MVKLLASGDDIVVISSHGGQGLTFKYVGSLYWKMMCSLTTKYMNKNNFNIK